MIKLIYAIGGAPRTGKTSVAKHLTTLCKCNYISLDDMRGWLKALKPEGISEDLYYDKGMEIEEFYEKYPNPEKVFELERKQNKAIEYAIKLMIERFYGWDKIIIEGIGITPEFVAELKLEYKVKELFLIAENPSVLSKRIYSDGLWDNEEPYSDKYKEIEKIWTGYYNDWFIQEVSKYNFKNTKIDGKNLSELITISKTLLS